MIGYIGINIQTDKIIYEEGMTYNIPILFFTTHFDVIHYPYNPSYTGYIVAEILGEPKESYNTYWLQADKFKVIKIIPDFNHTEYEISFSDGRNMVEITIPNKNGDINLQTIFYIKQNRLHRDSDLPALIRDNSVTEWFVNGIRHRDDNKPAIIRNYGLCEYFIHGIRQSSPVKTNQLESEDYKSFEKIKLEEKKRYFNTLYIDHENNIRVYDINVFSGTKPKKAAEKAFTHIYEIFKNLEILPENIIFCMYEINSNKKYYYDGRRIKLDTPEVVTIKNHTGGKPINIIYNHFNDIRRLSDEIPEYQMLMNYIIE